MHQFVECSGFGKTDFSSSIWSSPVLALNTDKQGSYFGFLRSVYLRSFSVLSTYFFTKIYRKKTQRSPRAGDFKYYLSQELASTIFGKELNKKLPLDKKFLKYLSCIFFFVNALLKQGSDSKAKLQKVIMHIMRLTELILKRNVLYYH